MKALAGWVRRTWNEGNQMILDPEEFSWARWGRIYWKRLELVAFVFLTGTLLSYSYLGISYLIKLVV